MNLTRLRIRKDIVTWAREFEVSSWAGAKGKAGKPVRVCLLACRAEQQRGTSINQQAAPRIYALFLLDAKDVV